MPAEAERLPSGFVVTNVTSLLDFGNPLAVRIYLSFSKSNASNPVWHRVLNVIRAGSRQRRSTAFTRTDKDSML